MRQDFVSLIVRGVGLGFLGCVLVFIGLSTASWSGSRVLREKGCICWLTASWVSGLRVMRHGFVSLVVRGVGRVFLGCASSTMGPGVSCPSRMFLRAWAYQGVRLSGSSGVVVATISSCAVYWVVRGCWSWFICSG